MGNSLPSFNEQLKLRSLPSQDGLNPYFRLFHSALRQYGIEYAGALTEAEIWKGVITSECDVVHLHFVDSIWLSYRFPHARRLGLRRLEKALGPIERLFAIFKLRTFLRNVRKKGTVVVWTCHDLFHPYYRGVAGKVGRDILASNVDLIVCHSEWCERQVTSMYPSHAPILVIPHGNYDGAFPIPRCRSKIRGLLGVKENTSLLLLLGRLRATKGYQTLLSAVRDLGDSVKLVIAGPCGTKFDLGWLKEAVEGLNNVELIVKPLSDQEVADYHNAADAVVLPYSEITTSGALLTALTFGRGVIASDVPFFREILGNERDAATLVPPNDPEALARGIRLHLSIPAEVRFHAARRLAEKFAWPTIVPPFVDAIRRLCRSRKVGKDYSR